MLKRYAFRRGEFARGFKGFTAKGRMSQIKPLTGCRRSGSFSLTARF
jgi:hypothetical protein